MVSSRGRSSIAVQRLEDALRLGTYNPAVHRAALNELRAVQLQLITRSQRQRDDRGANEPAHQSDVHRAARAASVAMAFRIRARPAQRGVISVLGRERLGQLLFDVSPEAVSIADESERILAVNPAFCRVTGYDLHEAVGRQLGFNGTGRAGRSFLRDRCAAISRNRVNGPARSGNAARPARRMPRK